MKFVVAKITSMINGDFKTRYTHAKCIEAESEKEAIDIYDKCYIQTNAFYPKSSGLMHRSYIRCVGIVDNQNRLLIQNFSLNYESSKLIRPTKDNMRNHLVSRLLNEPKILGQFDIYAPIFIQALHSEDAISIYENLYPSKKFEARLLGYLEVDDTFIVPNIFDYIN